MSDMRYFSTGCVGVGDLDIGNIDMNDVPVFSVLVQANDRDSRVGFMVTSRIRPNLSHCEFRQHQFIFQAPFKKECVRVVGDSVEHRVGAKLGQTKLELGC